MSEPTLAEIVERANSKTACAENYVCLRQDLAAFHARATALAEGWRCDSEALGLSTPGAPCEMSGLCRKHSMLALLGDLKP